MMAEPYVMACEDSHDNNLNQEWATFLFLQGPIHDGFKGAVGGAILSFDSMYLVRPL